MQTTATFDSAAPFAAGSVQVLVISVVAQLAAAAASARTASVENPRRAPSPTLLFMVSILRLMRSASARWGALAPRTTVPL